MTPGRFAGKVAIVTGAAGGIGAATARRLAEEGAHIVLADLKADATRDLAARFAQDGLPDAIGGGWDAGDEDQVQDCARTAVERFGRLDVIVNNAAIMVFKPIAESSAEDWLRVLRVSLLGPALFTREAFRHMQGGGAIVNIASVHARATSASISHYAASKAALLSLTRSTAIEGRERNIRANAILPGAIDTPMLWDNPNLRSGAEVIDPGDVGRPEDVAAAAAFLASDEAGFITGASLLVDGGRLARL